MMARGISRTLPTSLPAQFKRGVAWNVDRRRKAVREYAYDMIRLGNSLGGLDHLSEQQLWLVEEAAFWHGRLLASRAAQLSGRPPTMTPGEHQNATNTLSGLLAKLGLERQARSIETLRDVMRAEEEPESERGAEAASEAHAAHDEMIQAGEAPAPASTEQPA